MKERSASICWRSKRVAVTQGLQKPSIFGVEPWALESVSYLFTSFARITHRELVFNQAVVGRIGLRRMSLETRAMLVRTRIESLGGWLGDESKTKPRAPCNAMQADQGVEQQLGVVDGEGERARPR